MDSVQDTLAGGFPHSEIHGSKFVRNSPWLIAAYDVLHRLSAPRHPPNALTTLDRSHCRCPPASAADGIDLEKTSFFEVVSDRRRLRLRISRHAAGTAAFEQNLLFTMSDNTCLASAMRDRHEFCFRRTLLDTTQKLVEPDGIEPTTSCLQSRRSPN